MRVLGVNAIFHDSSAAVVVDGTIVAAAEEERFSRRKHGKANVAFSAWELPERAIAWCLSEAGLDPSELDAVAYGYDPTLLVPSDDLTLDDFEGLRNYYARQFPSFIATLFGRFDAARVHFVAHHVAHAASAYLCAPFRNCATLAIDGRGERSSFLAGHVRDGRLDKIATVPLPHSLGLRYEDLTEHLGFHRSSDEYKVMGMAAYGRPRFAESLRPALRSDGIGFVAPPIDFSKYCAPRDPKSDGFAQEHADLAASVQARLQDTLLEIATALYERTGEKKLAYAGGVALNCVANSHLARHGPFEEIWIQPAAGDAGTALGAALVVAQNSGDDIVPMTTAALGRGWRDADLGRHLATAAVAYDEPSDLVAAVAQILARDGLVAWFQGRSEFGPRALGHRSLFAHPGHPGNLRRLNDVKGREQFRPVAPMVLAERAAEIFDGPLPSPYMLFTHRVRDEWRDRIPAVTHVDGTARVQTIDADREPLVAALLREFEKRTGLPLLINTSLNTAGRPIVDDPRDALELFGSTPCDALAIGPYVLSRDAALIAAA